MCLIDVDIKGVFDEVSYGLLMKALDKHVEERWLQAPIETESKELVYRKGKGTL